MTSEGQAAITEADVLLRAGTLLIPGETLRRGKKVWVELHAEPGLGEDEPSLLVTIFPLGHSPEAVAGSAIVLARPGGPCSYGNLDGQGQATIDRIAEGEWSAILLPPASYQIPRQTEAALATPNTDVLDAATLLREAPDGNPIVRCRVADAIGERRLTVLAGALVGMLDDAEAMVRQAATQALGDLSEESTCPALHAILMGDDSPVVRQAAAEALGQIKGPTSQASLEAALSDSDAGVRETAAAALAEVGDESQPDTSDVPLEVADDQGRSQVPPHLSRARAVDHPHSASAEVQALLDMVGTIDVSAGVVLRGTAVDVLVHPHPAVPSDHDDISVVITALPAAVFRNFQVALLPETEGGAIRYGTLNSEGQLLIEDATPGRYRARLLGKARAVLPVEPLTMAEALSLKVTQPAAAAAAPPSWVQELASADNSLEARLSLEPVNGTLNVQVRSRRPDVILSSFSYQDRDGDWRRLLVVLAWDPDLGGGQGDARLGPAPHELRVGILEPVVPSSLTGPWVPVIAASVTQAAFHGDRLAWHDLSRRPEVDPEVSAAIATALGEAGFSPE